MKYKRIQRSGAKGWKMPPNTIYVGRNSKWSNPYRVGEIGPGGNIPNDIKKCVDLFDLHVWRREKEIKEELKGKNLACWCPLKDKNGNRVPCHADILLKIANEK